MPTAAATDGFEFHDMGKCLLYGPEGKRIKLHILTLKLDLRPSDSG